MIISTDGQKVTQITAQTTPNDQLSPQHILSCPAIQGRLFKISPEDPDDLIFFDKAVEHSSFPHGFKAQSNLAAYKTYNQTQLQHLVNNTHRRVLKDLLTTHKTSLEDFGMGGKDSTKSEIMRKRLFEELPS
ncbi:hypothetical protein TNCV_2357431 [Trichonephila clavipes]|nr:hypothetical protein TNCV_2357431 [Trichonephila clavipes]